MNLLLISYPYIHTFHSVKSYAILFSQKRIYNGPSLKKEKQILPELNLKLPPLPSWRLYQCAHILPA